MLLPFKFLKPQREQFSYNCPAQSDLRHLDNVDKQFHALKTATDDYRHNDTYWKKTN